MTIKQIILRFIYPLVRKLAGTKDKNSGICVNTFHKKAAVSFYSLQASLANKASFNFASLKGKKVLLVNVASNCGFTGQYKELEELSKKYAPNLVVLGFPANDFKEQEPGNDVEIEKFCRINYGVTFPLFIKGSVVKPGRQEVFEWLSAKDKNGWNDIQPSWNFCKYLVSEDGQLLATFKPYTSPLDKQVVEMIEEEASFPFLQPSVNEVNGFPVIR